MGFELNLMGALSACQNNQGEDGGRVNPERDTHHPKPAFIHEVTNTDRNAIC